MSSRLRKQFCKNGHNILFIKRNKYGVCTLCRRDYNRLYQKHYRKTHKNINYNKKYCKQYKNSSTYTNKINIDKRKNYQKKWYKTHKHISWKRQNIINYDGSSFTQLNYDRLYKTQQGRCFICKIHQTKLKLSLNVDHDHTTGIVRGLLCPVCNTKLGYYEDKEFHKLAKLYLNNFFLVLTF